MKNRERESFLLVKKKALFSIRKTFKIEYNIQNNGQKPENLILAENGRDVNATSNGIRFAIVDLIVKFSSIFFCFKFLRNVKTKNKKWVFL